MDPVLELYLTENSMLKYLVFEDNCRQSSVNSLYNRDNSEYFKQFEELSSQHENFYEYYQVTPDTYRYILQAVEDDLTRQSNFRKCVSPSEKLSVTLR